MTTQPYNVTDETVVQLSNFLCDGARLIGRLRRIAMMYAGSDGREAVADAEQWLLDAMDSAEPGVVEAADEELRR